jgi:hypothetical protein
MRGFQTAQSQTEAMAFFLLFLYSISTNASPLLDSDDDTKGASTSCYDLYKCRSLLSILWSCLTTIFLCTWVTIHPNISAPIDTRKMGFLDRCTYAASRFLSESAPLFLCALLIPEYILAWAIRQNLVAREIAKESGT